jgi:hypothetical protein
VDTPDAVYAAAISVAHDLEIMIGTRTIASTLMC